MNRFFSSIPSISSLTSTLSNNNNAATTKPDYYRGVAFASLITTDKDLVDANPSYENLWGITNNRKCHPKLQFTK
jgi:hypothetical protein